MPQSPRIPEVLGCSSAYQLELTGVSDDDFAMALAGDMYDADQEPTMHRVTANVFGRLLDGLADADGGAMGEYGGRLAELARRLAAATGVIVLENGSYGQ